MRGLALLYPQIGRIDDRQDNLSSCRSAVLLLIKSEMGESVSKDADGFETSLLNASAKPTVATRRKRRDSQMERVLSVVQFNLNQHFKVQYLFQTKG